MKYLAVLILMLSLGACSTETVAPALAPDYVKMQADLDAQMREAYKEPFKAGKITSSDIVTVIGYHPQAWLDRWVTDPTPENEQAYLEALRAYKEKFEELTN